MKKFLIICAALFVCGITVATVLTGVGLDNQTSTSATLYQGTDIKLEKDSGYAFLETGSGKFQGVFMYRIKYLGVYSDTCRFDSVVATSGFAKSTTKQSGNFFMNKYLGADSTSTAGGYAKQITDAWYIQLLAKTKTDTTITGAFTVKRIQ